MSLDSPIRWGVIGAGRIADKVAPFLKKAQGAELHAIASRERERAAAFAEKHQARLSYASYDDLLADPDIDAVYITTPNSLHCDHAVAAARAGKHVLCEKPLAARPFRIEEMFDAAAGSGVKMMEAFMYRFHPVITEMMRRIRAGDIGQPRLVHSSFGFRLSPERKDDIRLKSSLHGGALMDVGCYCLSASILVIGEEPERLRASAHIGPSEVDEWTSGCLGFPTGATATFDCSLRLALGATLQVWGEEGDIKIDNPWLGGDGRFAIRSAGNKEAEIVEVADETSGYQRQFEAFHKAIAEDAEPPVTRKDSLANARAIETLHKSIGYRAATESGISMIRAEIRPSLGS